MWNIVIWKIQIDPKSQNVAKIVLKMINWPVCHSEHIARALGDFHSSSRHPGSLIHSETFVSCKICWFVLSKDDDDDDDGIRRKTWQNERFWQDPAIPPSAIITQIVPQPAKEIDMYVYNTRYSYYTLCIVLYTDYM